MYICYIDESGDTGILPSTTSPVQPALVIGGVILPHAAVADVTREFVDLKRRFFPRLRPAAGQPLHWILQEVKGASVRANVDDPSRNVRRHAIGFLDHVLELLERHRARVVARVWIKAVGSPIYSTPIYNASVQYICTWFEHLLAEQQDTGLVVADHRTKVLNSAVSHSIFTGKFSRRGDRYAHLVELPTFGHSENHAGVQLADLLCSALLFPMAVHAYCGPHLTSLHVRPGYAALRARFGARLKALQHCGVLPAAQGTGRGRGGRRPHWGGGVTVDDPLGHQSRSLMFRPVAPAAVAPTP